MDFPIFHLDFLNNRLLIAIIAIIHVFINHSMAVGGIPLVTFLERKGLISGDKRWDDLAYKILFVFFIITTTVGAMTGVGIWFSASLINPTAIGSLVRVFFWTWFIEWIIFVTEVILIMFYFLTWKTWTGPKKAQHVKLGIYLSIASYITMVLIVAILGFMMNTGSWLSDGTLFSGMTNPLYLPQLSFRTPLAMLMAAGLALALIPFFIKKNEEFRNLAIKKIGLWAVFWIPFALLGSIWYRHAIPSSMIGNLQVAISTLEFTSWYELLQTLIIVCIGTIAIVNVIAVIYPKKLPTASLFIPAISMFVLIGFFERVREFIRKPYAIQGYLYSNGFREEEYALFKRDGILKYSTFSPMRSITAENTLEAGKEIFKLTCTRCHTINGVNSIRTVIGNMYGYKKLWDPQSLSKYMETMHNVRTYMPPFPGNEEERDALAAYLVTLQTQGDILDGVQSEGLNLPHK